MAVLLAKGIGQSPEIWNQQYWESLLDLTGTVATAVPYWSKQCKHGQTKILNE